jgi:hypothetical protein
MDECIAASDRFRVRTLLQWVGHYLGHARQRVLRSGTNNGLHFVSAFGEQRNQPAPNVPRAAGDNDGGHKN